LSEVNTNLLKLHQKVILLVSLSLFRKKKQLQRNFFSSSEQKPQVT